MYWIWPDLDEPSAMGRAIERATFLWLLSGGFILLLCLDLGAPAKGIGAGLVIWLALASWLHRGHWAAGIPMGGFYLALAYVSRHSPSWLVAGLALLGFVLLSNGTRGAWRAARWRKEGRMKAYRPQAIFPRFLTWLFPGLLDGAPPLRAAFRAALPLELAGLVLATQSAGDSSKFLTGVTLFALGLGIARGWRSCSVVGLSAELLFVALLLVPSVQVFHLICLDAVTVLMLALLGNATLASFAYQREIESLRSPWARSFAEPMPLRSPQRQAAKIPVLSHLESDEAPSRARR